LVLERSSSAALCDRIIEDGNAFLINTGDVVNEGAQDQFAYLQALISGFPLPSCPVPGNHDVGADGALDNYLAYSGAPARHYALDIETAHLTFVDSAAGILGEQELTWIDSDLSETEQPVKIVVLQHPPFDPDGTGHILVSGNQAFTELMRTHEVDYVLAGHIHAYAQAVRHDVRDHGRGTAPYVCPPRCLLSLRAGHCPGRAGRDARGTPRVSGKPKGPE